MQKSIILLFLSILALCGGFPYDDIRCSPPLAFTSAANGARLTLGSHNKSGDFVHMIIDQYVVLSGNNDTIVYPNPTFSYDLWEVCNCGIRNNASSFFLRSDSSSSELTFTGYDFLTFPYASLIPNDDHEVYLINVPNSGCPKCVLTANLTDNTVEVREFSEDPNVVRLQAWFVDQV